MQNCNWNSPIPIHSCIILLLFYPEHIFFSTTLSGDSLNGRLGWGYDRTRLRLFKHQRVLELNAPGYLQSLAVPDHECLRIPSVMGLKFRSTCAVLVKYIQKMILHSICFGSVHLASGVDLVGDTVAQRSGFIIATKVCEQIRTTPAIAMINVLSNTSSLGVRITDGSPCRRQ